MPPQSYTVIVQRTQMDYHRRHPSPSCPKLEAQSEVFVGYSIDDAVMAGNQLVKAFPGFSAQVITEPFLVCREGIHRGRKIGIAVIATVTRT